MIGPQEMHIVGDKYIGEKGLRKIRYLYNERIVKSIDTNGLVRYLL